MTETDEKGKKKLSLSSGGTLSLGKKIETSQVKQSFSHGRSKTVQVERRRKRAPIAQKSENQPFDENLALKNLTSEERAARTRALKEGLQQQENQFDKETETTQVEPDSIAEDTNSTEEISFSTPKEIVEKSVEGPVQNKNQQSVDEKEKALEEEQKILEAARLAEEEEARLAKAISNRQLGRSSEKASVSQNENDNEGSIEDENETSKSTKKRIESGKKLTVPAGRRGEPRRRHSGKLTISQALDDSGVERVRSLASVRRAREKEKKRAREEQGEIQKQIRDVIVPDAITVQELANRMAERAADVIKKLMELGVMATINQVIDADTAELVTSEFGHKVRRVSESDVETGLQVDVDPEESKELRAPVVTIMGHVDHGKTSLLDAMRKTDVVTGEAGGITQHIGAYQIQLESNDRITFLDTPGHAAFTEMRARGANVTDIIVLVVAADDGINDQTVEAIRHAKAAECPIIVAINKIDLPDANPSKVQTELLQYEIVVEELGGDVIQVPVSAKTGEGIDKLQEAILLQAEILELKANPNRGAAGTIVESKVERGRGSVATVLVQHGTLHIGDIFVAGAEWGRVRALLNDKGERMDDCGPSFPAEVLGLNGSPVAGDDFIVVENEARAREVVEYRQREIRNKQASAGARGTVEQMLTAIAAGHADELPILIKTDVHGSLEAIRTSLERISNDTVAVRMLHGAVGGISESDITLASASNAIIIGFNVRANPQARELARTSGVDIRYYSIIYNVIDDIKAALTGLLSPDLKEEFLGNAEIKEVFNISKVGKIAGCVVTEGSIKRGAQVRLLRDNVVIHEGSLKTLKHFKEEVKDIREGSECGAGFENYNDLQVGDFIECFEIKEIARTLESVQNEAGAS
ncbi:MAG: translation initiation factor IF-2 [Rhodospirillaceae bacterium]|nr:translation initiation factor IF-2 [Rhodospirillaceae bacterium]OUU27461.1 MAG: translation initiation factor IF-2 [Candidatus Endolissoclinum sp. TMED37]